MKKVNLFAILSLVFVVLACGNTKKEEQETNEYGNVLKEMFSNEAIQKSMNFGLDEMKQNLVPTFLNMGLDQETAEAKIDNLMDNIIDLYIEEMTPYVEKHMTLEELNSCCELYSNDKYQVVLNKGFDASAFNLDMHEQELRYQEVVNAILMGEEPMPVARSAGYDDDYLALCNEYAAELEMDMMVEGFLNFFADNTPGIDSDVSQKLIEKYTRYMNENYGTELANIYYGYLDEQDINLMIEIAKKPEMKKFQEASKDFINNMDEAFYNKMLAMVENLLKDLN